MNKNLQDRIYTLIGLKLANQATADELEELDHLLSAHSDFKELHDQLLQYPEWNETVIKDVTDQAYAAQYVKMMYADENDRVFSIEETDIPERHTKWKRIAQITAIAASLLLTILVSRYFIVKPSEDGAFVQKSVLAKRLSPVNSKSKLTLPDGTIVYLNANSHLEYGRDFNKKERNVHLVGEAFFDVAHNPNKPFFVHTDKATVRVLGTRFNVKSYSEELWETTLLQGKVELYCNARPKEKLQLEPSQKVSIVEDEVPEKKKNGYKIQVTKIKSLGDDVAETAWMDNKLVFMDTPLSAIAKELERQFGITVNFESDKQKAYKYTGVFDNESLQKILHILDLSKSIDYELKDNELVIK